MQDGSQLRTVKEHAKSGVTLMATDHSLKQQKET